MDRQAFKARLRSLALLPAWGGLGLWVLLRACGRAFAMVFKALTHHRILRGALLALLPLMAAAAWVGGRFLMLRGRLLHEAAFLVERSEGVSPDALRAQVLNQGRRLGLDEAAPGEAVDVEAGLDADGQPCRIVRLRFLWRLDLGPLGRPALPVGGALTRVPMPRGTSPLKELLDAGEGGGKPAPCE